MTRNYHLQDKESDDSGDTSHAHAELASRTLKLRRSIASRLDRLASACDGGLDSTSA
jgi:hypothetical protein